MAAKVNCCSICDACPPNNASSGRARSWLFQGSGESKHCLSTRPPLKQASSVELNPKLATAVTKLFRDHENVEIRTGDCMTVLADVEPFDLLFMDATPRQHLIPENWDTITEMVRVGGQIVFDDLAPLELWPDDWDDLIDLKREFAFHNPRVVGTEVRTTATQVALLITRIK